MRLRRLDSRLIPARNKEGSERFHDERIASTGLHSPVGIRSRPEHDRMIEATRSTLVTRPTASAAQWSLRPPKPFFEGPIDLSGLGMPAELGLREDERSVQRNLEATPTTWHEPQFSKPMCPAIQELFGKGESLGSEITRDAELDLDRMPNVAEHSSPSGPLFRAGRQAPDEIAVQVDRDGHNWQNGYLRHHRQFAPTNVLRAEGCQQGDGEGLRTRRRE